MTVFAIPAVQAAVVASLPEAMTAELPERDGAISAKAGKFLKKALRDFDAAVLGPGLTVTSPTRSALRDALDVRIPMVIDADALNAFAGEPEAFARRFAKGAATVLTQHSG